jgi:hypothetical protein
MEAVVTTIKLPAPVAAVCQAVSDLEATYGRKFTIDGHLLGSIGEVVAREALGFELYEMSRKGHDGLCKTRGEVQVKITSKKSIALRHPCNHLIVLKMDQHGKKAEIVYDRPGAPVWALRTSVISLYEVSNIVPDTSFLVLDLLRMMKLPCNFKRGE